MQHDHETRQLARAYVPFQERIGELYRPECALMHGTVFPELHQPYEYAGNGYGKERRLWTEN